MKKLSVKKLTKKQMELVSGGYFPGRSRGHGGRIPRCVDTNFNGATCAF